jgi:hypothetical protein
MRKSKKSPISTDTMPTSPYDQCRECTHIRRDHAFGGCRSCTLPHEFSAPKKAMVMQGDAIPKVKK